MCKLHENNVRGGQEARKWEVHTSFIVSLKWMLSSRGVSVYLFTVGYTCIAYINIYPVVKTKKKYISSCRQVGFRSQTPIGKFCTKISQTTQCLKKASLLCEEYAP